MSAIVFFALPPCTPLFHQDIKNSGWPHIFLIDTPTRAMYFFPASLSVCLLTRRVSAKGPKKDLVRRGSTMLFPDNLVRAPSGIGCHFAGRFILVLIF